MKNIVVTYVAWIRVRVSYRIRYGYGDTIFFKNPGYDTAIIYIIFYYFNYVMVFRLIIIIA